MAHHHQRRESYSGPFCCPTSVSPDATDLSWPFGKLESLDRDDIRETAYEVFFTACRSSPGFGGRNAITFYSSHDHGEGGVGGGNGSGAVGGRAKEVVMTPTSRVKRALGLKMLKRSPSRRMSTIGSGGGGSAPSSPNAQGHGSPALGYSTVPLARPRRPLTSAEIMRQQMRVTEQSDNRLRKTLMRTLVGQVRNVCNCYNNVVIVCP